MPVGASHLAVVDQAKNNLKKLETYITTGMDNTVEIALDIVEQDKVKCDARLDEMRKIMLEYARMERQLKDFVEIVDEVKQQAKTSEECPDLEKLLDQKLKERRTANRDMDLKDHDKYVDMDKRIDDMKARAEASETQGNKSPTQIDEDVAMTQAEVVTRCPYTGKDMINPVKNKLCSHNYEREAIEKYIKQKKGKAKCPVGGCVNDKPIDSSHLEENKDLKRFIENKNRQSRKGTKK